MQMTLEEYKQEIKQFLLKQLHPSTVKRLMKDYEKDFQDFYNRDWDVLSAGSAIMVGY